MNMKIFATSTIAVFLIVGAPPVFADQLKFPREPIGPTRGEECDALSREWSAVMSQALEEHSACLDSHKGASSAGRTCSVAQCQALHDMVYGGELSKARNAAENRCRASVAAYEERQRLWQQGIDRARQAAEEWQRDQAQAAEEQARAAEQQRQRIIADADHERRAAEARIAADDAARHSFQSAGASLFSSTANGLFDQLLKGIFGTTGSAIVSARDTTQNAVGIVNDAKYWQDYLSRRSNGKTTDRENLDAATKLVTLVAAMQPNNVSSRLAPVAAQLLRQMTEDTLSSINNGVSKINAPRTSPASFSAPGTKSDLTLIDPFSDRGGSPAPAQQRPDSLSTASSELGLIDPFAPSAPSSKAIAQDDADPFSSMQTDFAAALQKGEQIVAQREEEARQAQEEARRAEEEARRQAEEASMKAAADAAERARVADAQRRAAEAQRRAAAAETTYESSSGADSFLKVLQGVNAALQNRGQRGTTSVPNGSSSSVSRVTRSVDCDAQLGPRHDQGAIWHGDDVAPGCPSPPCTYGSEHPGWGAMCRGGSWVFVNAHWITKYQYDQSQPVSRGSH